MMREHECGDLPEEDAEWGADDVAEHGPLTAARARRVELDAVAGELFGVRVRGGLRDRHAGRRQR